MAQEGKKTGGRTKGARNKVNMAVEETAEKLGINFFQSLCYWAMGDYKALGYESEMYFIEKAEGEVKAGYVISPEMRMKATESVCKYLYSPKQSVQVTGDMSIKVNLVDYTKDK